MMNHIITEGTQRIPRKVLTLSYEVDECKPLGQGGGGGGARGGGVGVVGLRGRGRHRRVREGSHGGGERRAEGAPDGRAVQVESIKTRVESAYGFSA